MTIDDFLSRWTNLEGGAERANYQLFLTELCDVLEVARPQPAGATHLYNDYVFERAVRPRDSADIHAPKRIDLYKKGCFILEAKQSRLAGARNDLLKQGGSQTSLPLDEPEKLGKRGTGAKWDAMMRSARQQGERYVFLLDKSQPAPPFLIVCDVGHCLELYADFSGTGRDYTHFPDRNGFRIYLDDLRKPKLRGRLKTVWTDPLSLDPTRNAARVTREIAKRLAAVSKALEAKGANAEDVAHFLMRCLFTMFAEDIGLLPEASFSKLLEKSVADPTHFGHRLKALWKHMDEGEDFSHVVEARVRKFNGGLFKTTTVFELGKEEIGELLAASRYDWKEVDPAIFGTLLEQALDKAERRKLGAHYTPRAYVQRLVDVTIMEPLRADWQAALTRVEQAKDEGDNAKAIAAARAFHAQLCATRVLDPACGTGNFLYVSLELMKRLEGEVLEVLAKLGLETLGLEEVDPHRFLGLEINPRAAAIAELVIWIGYLQQHYLTRTGHPSEPILKDFKNINFGLRGGYDAVLTWDGYPVPTFVERDSKKIATYPRARLPVWPEAEFIVGNPPFIGNKRMNDRLGTEYSSALRKVRTDVAENADFVMYWWSESAKLLAEGRIRRFGLVSTNSIVMIFNRAVVQSYLGAKKSVSIIFAIPDHPWVIGDQSASIRIAMTVARKGVFSGSLQQVLNRKGGFADSDTLGPAKIGPINSMLSIGASLASAKPLLQNKKLSFMGVIPVSLEFVLSEGVAERIKILDQKQDSIIKPYLGGRALAYNRNSKPIIDFFGLTAEQSRQNYPHAYQHVLEKVKPLRDQVIRDNHRKNWWIFGEPRPGLREAIKDIPFFIATAETAKHRWFTFVKNEIIPDQKIRVVASDQFWLLAVMSSRFHTTWSFAIGGRVGKGNDPVYNNTTCFEPLPFPQTTDKNKTSLSSAAYALEHHRKTALENNNELSYTEIYNVLEKLKIGTALTPKDEDVKDRGLVLILKELHEQIDRLTAEAYGWPVDLSDDEILARLVALNAERAREEAAGLVRWLRPEYQIPRFGKQVAAAQETTGELDLPEVVAPVAAVGLPAFPSNRQEHPLVVERALRAAGRPMTATEIARGFNRGGKRVEQRVIQVLGTLVRYGRVTADGDRFAA